MASSAELAVAKASLSATLFRPDPQPCSRENIDHFFSLLNSAIAQCSPANVQKCKQWILLNLVLSNGRIAPFGRYLCALANSFTADKDSEKRKDGAGNAPGAFGFKKAQQSQRPHEPSAKRKRLHILYILNDILYHVKLRDRNDNFADKIESFLPALVRNAAAFPNCPKQTKKINDLVAIWEEKGYFGTDSVAKLHDAVERALVPDTSEDGKGAEAALPVSRAGKEAPFVMPAMHGDPNMPWYDLPAGNWLPVLEPNSTRPMKPSMIRPLQLAPGLADKTLVEAVNKLLVEVEKLYAKDSRQAADSSYSFDQMGEVVEIDEINGGIVRGETYYGWSRAFCEKMKARRRKGHSRDTGNDRRPSRSYSRSPGSRSRSRSRGRDSRSRSTSRPGMKRRRLSDSRTPPKRMQSRSRGSAASRSRSRGYSPRRRSLSRTRPRSRSRSRNAGKHSRSLSSGYSPPPPNVDPSQQQQQQQQQALSGGYNPYSQPPPFQPSQNWQPPLPMPPHPEYGGFQPPGPVPPPPPPNYRGQWPPPPPLPPLHQQQLQHQQQQQMGGASQQPFFHSSPSTSQLPGAWPVPPPPMPGMGMMPQHMNPQQQNPQFLPQQPQQWQQHQNLRNLQQPWNPQQQQQQQQQQQPTPQNPQNRYGWGGSAGGW